jgi:tetrahydromethanopterin S-methyltransferase subunit D
MIFWFSVHGVLIPQAAHYIPHGHGPDKEFMASSGIGVGPAN